MTPEILGEFYYHTKSSDYYLQSQPKRFIKLDSRNLKIWMRKAGIEVDREDPDNGLKMADDLLWKCQKYRAVDYAGPLAGWPAGLMATPDGRAVLVTSEAHPVQAKKGDTTILDRFFSQLLGAEQTTYFLCWLKVARESLIECDFRPGQMICFFGESGCGKSFAQWLITQFLGGRMAKPFRYMSEKTQFNSDLAGAEHLIIADEQASFDIRSRRNFGSKIKDFVVNLELSVHGKGQEAITLPTARRVTLSGNHETENLMIMPPLDDSIIDKLMLFKCGKADLNENRKKNVQGFLDALPALAWELERMKIPRAFHDKRYLVTKYLNPEILEALSDTAPESRLLEFIDQVIFTRHKGEAWEKFKDRIAEPWTGTAADLEQELHNSAFGFQLDRLFTFASACGTFLARLERKLPKRFGSAKSTGRTVWTIRKGSE